VATTRADGTVEGLYLLGASFVDRAGSARDRVAPNTLYAARHELGQWVARPIQRSPE
jgi:hypothetical protein